MLLDLSKNTNFKLTLRKPIDIYAQCWNYRQAKFNFRLDLIFFCTGFILFYLDLLENTDF